MRWDNEPKWWRRLHKHRPRRRAVRAACWRVRAGLDPEGLIWPLDKKPWIYYW